MEIIVLEPIVHIWHMAASDIFSPHDVAISAQFFLKKNHFAPPPTPIVEGLELGISFWHTYT